MTDDTDEPQYRTYHHAAADAIEVRDPLEDGDGLFTVRMPVASTGEVRNAGDDPLSRDAVAAMRDQINEGSVGVFLDHGGNMDIAGSRYSAVGKVGEWQEAELTVNERGGGDGETTLLVADARLMDPETLPAATGPVRTALATIKSQVERDLGLSSSIGWRDDDSMPGGVDLMEASIVGIPADPRTTTASAVADVARAVGEARPDADPVELVAEFRTVLMGPEDSTVTDDDTESGERDTETETEADADGPADTPDPDTEQEAQDDDFREWMREQTEQQTEILRTLADAIREGDKDEDDDEEDEDDDEEDGDEEQSADAPDEEQSAAEDDDPADERGIDVDGETVTAEEVREMRAQLADADPAAPDDGDESDDEQRETNTTDDEGTPDLVSKYGLTREV